MSGIEGGVLGANAKAKGLLMGELPPISSSNAIIIIGKEIIMSKVQINTESPDFVLNDFDSKEISLSNYRNKKNVLLVFNRGFL